MPRTVKPKRRWAPNGPVNVHEAKTHFSKLLARAARGEEVVIAKAGKPVAKLVPIESALPPRRFGTAKGLIWTREDIDEPWGDDVLDSFYNSTFEPNQSVAPDEAKK